MDDSEVWSDTSYLLSGGGARSKDHVEKAGVEGVVDVHGMIKRGQGMATVVVDQSGVVNDILHQRDGAKEVDRKVIT